MVIDTASENSLSLQWRAWYVKFNPLSPSFSFSVGGLRESRGLRNRTFNPTFQTESQPRSVALSGSQSVERLHSSIDALLYDLDIRRQNK